MNNIIPYSDTMSQSTGLFDFYLCNLYPFSRLGTAILGGPSREIIKINFDVDILRKNYLKPQKLALYP